MSEASFDVFLSHNSQDKPLVERLAQRLEDEAHLKPWLDKWHLIPGQPWQEGLEQALEQSLSCAVFIGPSNISPWEHEEMRSALDRRVNEADFRVVPVLLPGASMPERGAMPRFLSRLTWVDFRSPEGIHDAHVFHRLVAGIRGVPPGRDGTASAGFARHCPYQGLKAFDETQARFFFGREAMTQHLIEVMRHDRFLAVLGPSGSGKSSVVRAGLLPQLRAGALPGSEQWRYIVFAPNANPLQELALHLVRAEQPSEGTEQALRLMGSLATDERALHMQVRLALADAPSEARFCIVVDQFEEIFTLCRDRTEREQFVDLLRYAATIGGGQTLVVVTMRADFIPRATEYTALAEILSINQFLVSPMEAMDLRRAVEEPALRLGVQFEAGLVEAILEDVDNQPGALPLMQHALELLWEAGCDDGTLSLKEYREIGSVQGALAKRADTIYDAFTPEQKQIARRILLRLTQPGDQTEDTRRRAALSELHTREDDVPMIEEVVQTLADGHLLVTSDGQLDVAHEALIRGWPRLRQWIDENRAALLEQRRMSEASEEWQRLGRDADALFRGTRLEQALAWREQYEADLNDQERAFLDASLALKVHEEEERQAQQRRELEQARALAEAESKRAESQLRAARRLRLGAALLSVVMCVAIVAAVLAWRERRKAAQQARLATANQLAIQALNQLGDGLDIAYLLSAEAYRLTEEAKHDLQTPKAQRSEAEKSVLAVLNASPRLKAFLRGHESTVWSVDFSPDGKTLAEGSGDGRINLWDVTKRTSLGYLPPTSSGAVSQGHDRDVWSVAFNHDGSRLASGSGDGLIILWDVKNRREVQRLAGHKDEIWGLAFSPDGTRLVSGGRDDTVILWDANTGKPLHEPLKGHQSDVWSVAFSADGDRVASGSWNGAIRIWDVESGEQIARLYEHEAAVISLAFHPADNTLLASGSRDDTIRLWRLIGHRHPRAVLLDNHHDDVWGLDFSPDGRRLASGSGDGSILLWDVNTGQPLEPPLVGHRDAVWDVSFSSDGALLASGSGDTMVILWDATAGEPLGQPLVGHQTAVSSLAFSPDGETLASGSGDHLIVLWHVPSGKPLGAPLYGHQSAVRSMMFSPDGKMLASGSEDGSVMFWDVASRQLLSALLDYHQDDIITLAFSADGALIASGGEDGLINLWRVLELRLGEQRQQIFPDPQTFDHPGDVWSIVFRPEGPSLVSSTWDGAILVCGIESGICTPKMDTQKRQRADIGEATLSSVAFSPDGAIVVAGRGNGSVLLREVATGERLGALLQGHQASVSSVAFGPDGTVLAAGAEDGVIRLWTLSEGMVWKPYGSPLQGSDSAVISLAFSPDGTRFASGDGDGSIDLWKVENPTFLRRLSGPGATVWRVAGTPEAHSIKGWRITFASWRAYACGVANRNLTCSEWQFYLGDEPYRATCPALTAPACP